MPKAVVVPLLPAGRERHGPIISRFITYLKLVGDEGESEPARGQLAR
jgi:hypothetical protein